jgi:hypothetical protein
VKRRALFFVVTTVILSIAADVALLHFNSISHAASTESVEINEIFRVLLLIAVPVFILVLLSAAMVVDTLV